MRILGAIPVRQGFTLTRITETAVNFVYQGLRCSDTSSTWIDGGSGAIPNFNDMTRPGSTVVFDLANLIGE
ncbi:Uncharacterized protein HZ326_25992 [Fusarium oxysporum f. sp. albedinis]|nr:Uncharacterized protein HZ326_25992 [Fusarium oxysporum f. sp. albedinis]